MVLVVLILQVVDNIALVVIDESDRGTVSVYTWTDILHILDIICCCLILMPIVWSIRHLREASASDGKAAINLQKLTQFRSFYVSVVAYVYFTRIVVLLLTNFLEFHLIWLESCLTEIATLMFYVLTGYKFRPNAENPYLPVNTMDDEEMEEFGLSEDGEADVHGDASDVRVTL